ncbi:hypothetical protein C8F01DRAFT_1084232 [Mycena amicta]|nr:hypothetical protein C8F01DRAFT_1084232 [Mycena amicta]
MHLFFLVLRKPTQASAACPCADPLPALALRMTHDSFIQRELDVVREGEPRYVPAQGRRSVKLLHDVEDNGPGERHDHMDLRGTARTSCQGIRALSKLESAPENGKRKDTHRSGEECQGKVRGMDVCKRVGSDTRTLGSDVVYPTWGYDASCPLISDTP